MSTGRTIPQPSPIGIAIVLSFGLGFVGIGCVVGLVSPPLSGGTLAAALLIAAGAWLLVRITRTTSRISHQIGSQS